MRTGMPERNPDRQKKTVKKKINHWSGSRSRRVMGDTYHSKLPGETPSMVSMQLGMRG